MTIKPIKLASLGNTHRSIGMKGNITIVVAQTPRTVKFYRVYPAIGDEDSNCFLFRSYSRSEMKFYKTDTERKIVESEGATPIAQWMKERSL